MQCAARLPDSIEVGNVGLACDRGLSCRLALQIALIGVVAAIDLRGELVHLVVLDRDRGLKIATRSGELRAYLILHRVSRVLERGV